MTGEKRKRGRPPIHAVREPEARAMWEAGGSVREVAKALDVHLRTVQNWFAKFVAEAAASGREDVATPMLPSPDAPHASPSEIPRATGLGEMWATIYADATQGKGMPPAGKYIGWLSAPSLDLVADLVRILAVGVPSDTACEYLGIPEAAFASWLERGRTIQAEALAGADDFGDEAAVFVLLERGICSMVAWRKTMMIGKVVKGSPGWQSAKWWLETQDPQNYKPKPAEAPKEADPLARFGIEYHIPGVPDMGSSRTPATEARARGSKAAVGRTHHRERREEVHK